MREEYRKENTSISEQFTFAVYTIVIFGILSLFLFAIDFVPELQIGEEESQLFPAITTEVEAGSADTTPIHTIEEEVVVEPSVPLRIKIEEIGLDTTIITPASSDIAVLDRALVSGAVLYPGSGLLNENANMLLFGHSSYLPVVHNKAYKAFNEIGKLKSGDGITVYSDSHEYTYVVETVHLSEAEDVLVHFESSKPILTLATCNTFGEKQERWVVTATYVSKEVL